MKKKRLLKGHPCLRHYAKFLLLMKFSIALVLISSLQVSAKTYSQEVKLTLSMNHVSIGKVLKTIERKTDYKFVYSDNLFPVENKVNVNVKEASVPDILVLILEKTGFTYKKVDADLIILTNNLTNDFEMEVHGTVTAPNGDPLESVTVAVEGAAVQTLTNAGGAYNITVPANNSVLTFSFVGYLRSSIAVNGRAEINMVLQRDEKIMGEVVVVGYGSQLKRDLTGAVAQIKADDIRGLAVTGFDQAIQGKVAGVTVVNNSGAPGGSVSIKIRGVGSINGNSEPLYVIDGIPTEGGLNALNPNDIETIDIMKDASAAAIYGSRASNGVVIITTRRGKPGKVQIDLDAFVGTQSFAKKLKVLNTPQLFSLAKEAFVNQKNDPRYSGTPAALLGPNPDWDDASKWSNTDWQDEISRQGTIQSYNLRMSGGSKNFRSSTMFGYYKMNGVLINSEYERFSIRSNNNYEVNKWLRGGFTLALSKEKTNAINADRTEVDVNIAALQLATRTVPFLPLNAPDGYGSSVPGSLIYGYNGYAFWGRRTTSDAKQQFYYPNNMFNPVYQLSSAIEQPNDTWRILGGTYLEVEPLTGLRLRSTLNADYGTSAGHYGQPQIDNETNILNGQGIAYFADNKDFTWNWVNTLTYEKSIGKHAFNLLAGTDALNYLGHRTSITGVGFAPGEKFVPDNALSRSASSFEISNSLFSYLGRVTYAFDDKYLMAFNIRRDGSSRFGPLNRYGTFPSGSVGWRISQEKFMLNVKGINELKLRGSYGILGNQKIPDFRYLSTYSGRDNVGYGNFQIRYPLGPTNGGFQTTQSGIALSNLANEGIKWEESSQLDIGLDAVLFNNKVNVTIDYYKKKVYDLLGDEPVPITFGSPTNSRFGNFASLENKGWEFTIGFKQKIGKVNFEAQFNAATSSNKVTSIGNSSDISRGFGSLGSASTKTVAQQPISQYYGYVTDGIYQNQSEVDKGPKMPLTVVAGDRRYKDISGPQGLPDGLIDQFDRTYLGNGFAKWSGGLNLSADYKGFDMVLFLTGQTGAKAAADWMRYAYDIRNFGGDGFQNASADMLNRWQKEGDQTNIPHVGYDQVASNYWFSDFFVRKVDFVRLRNVQVGYSIPAKKLNSIGITKARLYISAQNLFTLTKYNGFDPEIGVRPNDVNGGNSILLTGVDSGRYPTSRVFTAGVNIGF